MKNTGRILRGLNPQIKRIVFDKDNSVSIDGYLKFSCKVDKAHLLMLVEQGLIDKNKAVKILNEITHLEQNNFQQLQTLKQERGIFSLYEDYLIKKLGIECGGILQYGRSRNDLNATVSLLKFREIYLETHSELLRLINTLYKKGAAYKDVEMPAYTHFQPAVPITYGHWLLGICFNLERSLITLQFLEKEIQICPLGACSVGGTTIPIDNKITSELLGFDYSFDNSVDSVASRNWVLTYLSTIAVISNTLSRVANQLLVFSTQEFNFFELPDEIVGSSSLMPNKRNPFILEHITGKSGNVYGAFISALSAMHGTLFSNSISVSQESLSCLLPAANEVINSTKLLSLFILYAKPNKTAMKESNLNGNTIATELANELVRKNKISFRGAHKIIGAWITLNGSLYKSIPENDTTGFGGHIPEVSEIIERTNFGGGAGSLSINQQLKIIAKKIKCAKLWNRNLKSKWKMASNKLESQTI